MIPLSMTSLTDDDIAAATDVLSSGMLVQGERVAQFEEAIALTTGARYSVVMSSCTAALHVSLLGLGIGRGDLVIVPAYSWPATANVVEVTGASVIFVDIDHETYNIDPDQLSSTLRQLVSTNHILDLKAIIVVHAFGLMAANPRILELAAEHQIPIVEDAACALGAELDDRPAGSWGDIGCFSFHPRKLVTTGEGGAIVTDDEGIAAFAREFRDHGRRMTGGRASFVRAGLNYRLTDFQAALGLSQLARIDEILERRRHLAGSYMDLLDGLPLVLPIDGGLASTWQSFVVRLESGTNREAIISKLAELGIESSLGTIALPLTEHFSELSPVIPLELSVVGYVSESSLSLPFFTTMTSAEQRSVAQALEVFL